jgi:hypothetical protein
MTNNPLGVCYSLTNSSNPLDLGIYTLENGNPLFDIGILFAANINYNTATQEAYLYFNDSVSNILKNVDTYIRPLQAKGIKVLLSILGNHQGAGISNFPTQAAATAFAQQLTDAVNTYGLDGIDFDDEWSEYGNNGTGQPNDFSFPYLVSALREQLPDKLITMYFIGPAAGSLSYGTINVGSLINYSWNPYYGTFNAPDIPGMSNNQLSAAAVGIAEEEGYTPPAQAAQLATQTLQAGYGVYMYYNLPDSNQSAYLTQVSQALYGQGTVYTG